MLFVTGGRVNTITAARGMNDRVVLNLAGNGGRGFAKSVSDIAQREIFRKKRIDADTVVGGKMFGIFVFHK